MRMGSKISIETVPIRFLAVKLTETAVPEVSAAQEKLACVDGVENPDAVFEIEAAGCRPLRIMRP